MNAEARWRSGSSPSCSRLQIRQGNCSSSHALAPCRTDLCGRVDPIGRHKESQRRDCDATAMAFRSSCFTDQKANPRRVVRGPAGVLALFRERLNASCFTRFAIFATVARLLRYEHARRFRVGSSALPIGRRSRPRAERLSRPTRRKRTTGCPAACP
jgi:hypothetical protein